MAPVVAIARVIIESLAFFWEALRVKATYFNRRVGNLKSIERAVSLRGPIAEERPDLVAEQAGGAAVNVEERPPRIVIVLCGKLEIVRLAVFDNFIISAITTLVCVFATTLAIIRSPNLAPISSLARARPDPFPGGLITQSVVCLGLRQQITNFAIAPVPSAPRTELRGGVGALCRPRWWARH
jgi:hypothetical protein